MNCWNCKKPVDVPSSKHISFRLTCDHCSSWLHCCVNCKYFKPGLPNDCKVPGTEPIKDRQGVNFCEEFKLKENNISDKKTLDETSKKLFGEISINKKPTFEDLFND